VTTGRAVATTLGSMETGDARSLAHASHITQRDRRGQLVTEHVERVAGNVPSEARAIAFLHDVLELTDIPYEALRDHGLTEVEAGALELLTRTDGELYELYILRIAHATGAAGRLARAVKVADLEDHLQSTRNAHVPGDPPYAWARRHIAIAQARRGERSDDRVAYLPAQRHGQAAAG
jgi:hypothetical protein